MGTDVAVRGGFDLSRAPAEKWNAEMLSLVAKTVFRGQEVTQAQLYYCLTVAEGVRLNPMIGEIYFIPTRSTDGKGPTILPYVGRNGLVKKAREHGYHYESDTVHANDKFTIRRVSGEIRVTHSYGAEARGEIVGAYAFLHDDEGKRKSSFFYAPLDEYLPTFNEDWKMKKSPWGNQRSAMIEKCAMIGAGRKRLDLGNVLADGELDRVQLNELGPGGEAAPAAEFDWGSLAATDAAVEELREAVGRVREVDPMAWPAAKLEMVATGMDEVQVRALAAQIEEEANQAASRAPRSAPGRSGPPEGDSPSEPSEPGEGVIEAQVVEDEPDGLDVLPDDDTVSALARRAGELEDRLNEPGLSVEDRELVEQELDIVERQKRAAEDVTQRRLDV